MIISEEIFRIDSIEYIVVNRIDWFSLSIEIFSTFVKITIYEKV
jgi:hypothetical protein